MDPGSAPRLRFAPSPNGGLHLGHAYSALLNRQLAAEWGGSYLLRIEDIDRARCTPALERAMIADLDWLGALPPPPYRRQSEHMDDYAACIDALVEAGLAYPSVLTRGEVRAHVARMETQTGMPWPRDPDGAPHYPGTERDLSAGERRALMQQDRPYAIRLDMAAALTRTGPLTFLETDAGGSAQEIVAEPQDWGDVILARRDVPTSYHLSVVVDDALQGISHVVRGADLIQSTSVHRVLQTLLGLPAPTYRHHPLILDAEGRKLSKSRDSTALSVLRGAGLTPADIARMVGLG
ncbi:tRNA glutamyl-Q(34) synthetase GluQRS [Aureimonas frigidaquae]|uniref:Glutamyl-tRNA Synthetase n=1 Tax=Aureimonas frigidaquae TaxID=424757 RepID=A0A0N7KXK9_9HYPH|nr:tRNA glutamyl-Q(34) synthetase GluQRS [Aureimonas frigidaquae]BAT27209.1 glutamyl-tRNA Synthetase [Aureimonas frigidaquae]